MSRNNFNMQNNNNLPVYNDSESLHYRQMNYKNSTKTGPADLNNNPPPSSRNGPPPGTQNNLGQPEMREAAGMSNNAGPGPNGPPPNIAPPMTGRHNSNGMGETGAGMNGDRGNLGPNGYSNPRGDMSHQMNMNMEPHRQNSMARQTSMPGQNLNEMRDPYSNSQYSLTDVRKWIKDLRSDNPEEKYNALTHLSRIREDKSIERELPNLLWHSPLTVTISEG